MSCTGVHFALTAAQSEQLWERYEAEDDDGVLQLVRAIEDAWDEAHLQETDKAWDAIHRCLSDGTLDAEADTWPMGGAVLGGECMYFGDDHIVRAVDADDVVEIAAALATVTQGWFAGRFATLKRHGYDGAGDERDLAYTWHWFEQMRAFFARTAAEKRGVVFSADQ
jgi:hypothetical protein